MCNIISLTSQNDISMSFNEPTYRRRGTEKIKTDRVSLSKKSQKQRDQNFTESNNMVSNSEKH